ncbi:hypothetical protein F4X86_00470 [Candidatus Saccharibacteria bacterium]|nr:hypothetical protein [Candidatus Saccharibacteria bacterium]
MDKIAPTDRFWRKNALFIAALLVAVAVTWQIIEQANRNHRLQRQAGEIEAMNSLLEQQKKNQALDNEFLRSEYYLDLAIREQQGYTLPGESVLIISGEKISRLKATYQPQAAPAETDEPVVSNLSRWRDFIFGADNSP